MPPRNSPSPRVPAPIAALTRGVFAALAAARRPRADGHRGARVLHPDGIGFAAKLELGGADAGRDSLLGRPATHPAIVRLSRAVGLPRAIPEPLGVAVRIVDARGPGEHQDLLFATSAQSPLARHALFPGLGGFFDQFFSSLWPYRVDGAIRMLGLSPAGAGSAPRDLERLGAAARGRCYRLCAATMGGPWLALGQVEIGERLPDDVVENLRFNPWNTRPDLRPVGPLMGLRDAAYGGSQLGRLPADASDPAPVSENGRRSSSRLGGRLSRA
jgi:hypothetical protein